MCVKQDSWNWVSNNLVSDWLQVAWPKIEEIDAKGNQVLLNSLKLITRFKRNIWADLWINWVQIRLKWPLKTTTRRINFETNPFKSKAVWIKTLRRSSGTQWANGSLWKWIGRLGNVSKTFPNYLKHIFTYFRQWFIQ